MPISVENILTISARDYIAMRGDSPTNYEPRGVFSHVEDFYRICAF